jgi:hypothetical protein
MTTQREMELSYAAQQAVIISLLSIGERDLAARLDRCMMARRSRHYGDGWPFSCRSAACVWCRRAMIRGWWAGMQHWSTAGAASLVIIPLRSPAGTQNVAHRLRRGLRDVRDRMARRRNRWRELAFAGMVGGDSRAVVLILHEEIDRCEVLDVLRHRWPDVVIKEPEQEEPTWAMLPDDAAELGRCRRGIEPLRVVIMPQRDQEAATSRIVEPMPVLV